MNTGSLAQYVSTQAIAHDRAEESASSAKPSARFLCAYAARPNNVYYRTLSRGGSGQKRSEK